MSFRARVARLFQPRVRTLFGEQSYAGLIINPLKVAAFVHLFLEYFYTPKGTYGPSMLPTINLRDDWVIISRLYSRGKGIEVGDVISLLHPMVPGEAAVKRVLGMPGDFVLRDTPGKGQDLMLQVGSTSAANT
ncbi:MAG: hypothetical protein M1817_005687 [Caeruleum heppii]|nr:MAG: hypothetical protein M1817_005687 [Caeruleum heppii]